MKDQRYYLGLALQIAVRAFKDIYDKQGIPYIYHCLGVESGVDQTDLELRQIALLHDLFEDTEITPEYLRSLGFSERVIVGIISVTHNDEETYMDYVKRAALNPDGRVVKIADLKHNTRLDRSLGSSKRDMQRLAKYHKAYNYLIAF